MNHWRIRAYQSGDEVGIAALFAHAFHKPLSRAHWQWKLRTLPSPTENEWVAEANGRIPSNDLPTPAKYAGQVALGGGGRAVVGHYALMPIRFQIGARVVIVPHGCDAMTHADFRRQGILTALSERANEVWRDVSPFQIGFHYGGWGSVRERVGWRPVARVVWLKKLLRPVAVLLRRVGLRAPRFADAPFIAMRARPSDGVDVTRVTRAGDEFDVLWQKISGAYDTLAVRDRAWVQWRYLDHPDADQRVRLATRAKEPCGYLAYRLQRDARSVRAAILDLFAAPNDGAAVRALLAGMERDCCAERVESVAMLAATDSPLYRALRRHGFWPSQHGFDFCVTAYAPQEFSMEPRAWFITGAEGDVI